MFDGLSRPLATFLSCADADDGCTNDVSGDTVIEQVFPVYDDASNTVATSRWLRFDDTSGGGPLSFPSGAAPLARVYQTCVWPDGIGRTLAVADYGTNGGSPVTRPATIPAASDTVLVSLTTYDDSGDVLETTDPQGTVTRTEHDALDRPVTRIENYTGGSPTSDTDKTTAMTYAPDGGLATLTLLNATTGDQVTVFDYGTTLTESGVATSSLLRRKIFPTGGTDKVEYAYDSRAALTFFADQNGTEHTYTFDKLGRRILDAVTTPGSGVDGAVLAIGSTFDSLNRPLLVTSYSDAAATTVVNEVARGYDGFGNVLADTQEHDGAVSGGSPVVAYTYADGAANTARLLTTTYPDGREIGVDYGASGSVDDALARPAGFGDSVLDDVYAYYGYLGAATIVTADYPEPGVGLTYVKQGVEPDGDAGDQYAGLDRFGRIIDRRWRQSGSDVDRFKYGYTRASLRQWRQNVVAATGQDEYYGYDGLYQVTGRELGTLNGTKTGITGTPEQTEAWTFDQAGNWLDYDQSLAGTPVVAQTRTHNEVNEIVNFDGGSAPVAFDLAGNMTRVPAGYDAFPGATLKWDPWGRLVGVCFGSSSSSSSSSSSGGGTPYDIRYGYDGFFRRTKQTVLSGPFDSSDFYYNLAWKCVETRFSGTTTVKTQTLYGAQSRNDTVCRETSGGRIYASTDAMLSATATYADDGTVLQRYRYTAFGDVTPMDAAFAPWTGPDTVDWRALFHGETADDATCWYNYGYRYYLPTLGRWLSRDPIGEEGGINLYAMVGNDLINLIDDYGLIKFENCSNDQEALAMKAMGGVLNVFNKMRDTLDKVKSRLEKQGNYSICAQELLKKMKYAYDAYNGEFVKQLMLDNLIVRCEDKCTCRKMGAEAWVDGKSNNWVSRIWNGYDVEYDPTWRPLGNNVIHICPNQINAEVIAHELSHMWLLTNDLSPGSNWNMDFNKMLGSAYLFNAADDVDIANIIKNNCTGNVK